MKRLHFPLALLGGLAGFCLGACASQIFTSDGKTLPLHQMNLESVPEQELRRRLHKDITTLRHVVDGLERLQDSAGSLYCDVLHRVDKAKLRSLTQDEDDQVRRLMLSYLNYRNALFRILAYHSSYDTIHNEDLKLQSFLVGYGAALTLFEKGAALVTLFHDDPYVRRKLNEPEPLWGIPANTFDMVYFNVSQPGNVKLLSEAREDYLSRLPLAQSRGLVESPEWAWLPEALDKKQRFLEANAPSVWQGVWESLVAQAKKSTYRVTYRAQSFLASLAGDIRFSAEPPKVTRAAIHKLRAELEPGDIILTRHSHYLSNGFLPGFWTHSILYVGSADELEASGLALRPPVHDRMDQYRRPSEDGEPNRVIEAVSEGVVFNSLEQALAADYVAVLRPRVSRARKDDAVERAFAHAGKPYDFEFDFFSSDSLVCTEVIFRAYDEDLGGERMDFRLVRVMGRETYPAIAMVKKFAAESGRDDHQLDFVAFLDGEKRKDAAALIASAGN